MAQRILVTGGVGFIGYHTANKLRDVGYEVRVFDNLHKQVHPSPEESLTRLKPGIEFIRGDVCKRSQLQAALKGVDAVYHFAAETGVGQSMYEIERYCDVNVRGIAVLCDCLARTGNHIEKVILSSSRAVYGEGAYACARCGEVYPEPRSVEQLKAGGWEPVCPHCCGPISSKPSKETTPCRPLSVYGITKKVQEDLLTIFSKTFGVPVVILRYFNVFGPGQSVANPYTGVLSIFTSRMLSNKDIEIYEDGQMQRDFVSVEDVVVANLRALELDITDVLTLNVGTGQPRTIQQLVEELKKETAGKSPVEVTSRFRLGDIRHCYADTSKALEWLGPFSKDSFENGLKSLVTWVKSEKKGAGLERSISELDQFGLTGKAQKGKQV